MAPTPSSHKVAQAATPSMKTSILRRTFRDPMRQGAVLAIYVFVVFVAEGAAAIVVHSKPMLYVSGAFHGIAMIGLLLFYACNAWIHRRHSGLYDANLANTILTCLLTMAVFSIMYPFVWYPALNRDTLTQAVQDMETLRPPAVAFISIKSSKDSNRIASLYNDPLPNAFVTGASAGFHEGIPQCGSQTREEILSTHYCNCSEMFSPVLEQPPPWYSEGFAYQTFSPAAKIEFNSTKTSLALQVFPRHNTSDVQKGWPKPGPALFLMLYDADIAFMEAFTGGLAATMAIPMLAGSVVMVSPIYRVGWSRKPYYYYKMATASVPVLNDVCDRKTRPGDWCYTSVDVQFTDMTRTVQTRGKAAFPGDVFAQAGGYFAIFQLLAWAVSGMAFGREREGHKPGYLSSLARDVELTAGTSKH